MRRRRVRRLAAQISGQRPAAAGLRLETGCLVDSVTPNASREGQSLVTVVIGEDSIAAPYVGSAPTQGTRVAVLLQDGSPLIIGTPAGFPIV